MNLSKPGKRDFWSFRYGGLGFVGLVALVLLMAFTEFSHKYAFSTVLLLGGIFELLTLARDTFKVQLYQPGVTMIGRFLVSLGGWFSTIPVMIIVLFSLVWIGTYSYLGLVDFGSGILSASIDPEAFGRFVLWGALGFGVYKGVTLLTELFKETIRETKVYKNW